MISMLPAPAALAERPELPSERSALIEQSCTTTHWPHEGRVVSQGPPGSGVGDVRRLSPEARALALGEPCFTRHRYRSRMSAEHTMGMADEPG